MPITKPIKIAIDFKNPVVNRCNSKITISVTPPKIRFLGLP